MRSLEPLPPSRAPRFSLTSTASPPAPLAIRKTPSGRRRKSRRQSHKFFKHLLRLAPQLAATPWGDRKSTRLNSSHGYISYAVFCLKKKKKQKVEHHDSNNDNSTT